MEQGRVGLAKMGKQVGQVDVRDGVVGVDPEGLFELPAAFVIAAQVCQGGPQSGSSLRRSGVEIDGLTVMLQRFFEPMVAGQRVGQVRVDDIGVRRQVG